MNREDYYKKYENMTYEQSFELAEKEFSSKEPDWEDGEEIINE